MQQLKGTETLLAFNKPMPGIVDVLAALVIALVVNELLSTPLSREARVEMAFLASLEILLLKPYLDLEYVDVVEKEVLPSSMPTEDKPRIPQDID